MSRYDPESEYDTLMERLHQLTERATAAWAGYRVLRDSLPRSDCRVALARGQWLAVENARRALFQEIVEVDMGAAA